MQILPLIIIYAGAMLLATILAALGWQRRHYRGGRTFSLMMAALAFWLGCHILALLDPTPVGTLRWMTLQYGGIMVMAPSWLLFALAYSGQWWRTTRWMRRSVFILPAILYACALTNESHGLWWTSATLDLRRSYVYLYTTNGPLFWLHAVYGYLCTFTGIVLLSIAARRLSGPSRTYARLVLVAAIVPPIGNLLYLSENGFIGAEDPTPLLILVAGVMIFYAMIRYRAVDLAPIAEREIFSLLPDGVLVLDTSATVASHNDLAARMLALPPGQLLGQRLEPLARTSPLIAELYQLVSTHITTQTRLINYEHHGELRGLEVRMQPLRTRNGAIAGALLVLRDTTERLRLEQARTRNLAQIETLNAITRAANSASTTDQLLDMMLQKLMEQEWWDDITVGIVNGEGSLEIVASSPGAETINTARLVVFRTALEGQQPRIIHATDEALPADTAHLFAATGLQTLMLVPLVDQGRSLGLLSFGNHKERPIAEELLRLAETLGELTTDAIVRIRLYEEVQRANNLKSAFLATMSHELRTPLTSIIGYVEMLQRGTYGQLGERTREPLAFMRYSSVTLLNLINDILDFSRMEAGFLTIDLQPVQATRALYNVIGALRPQIEEKQLTLELQIDPDLPPVQANTARLEQVIANLITNAIKFTPRGTITIQARQHSNTLRISVSDTGIGIAPEDQEVIFKEFHRVEQRQNRKVGGTGLGLAISRRLVQLMQGSLTLESTPNHGSTFHIDLPLAVLSASPPTVMEVNG
jgi:PAS domain S-box-containing protein